MKFSVYNIIICMIVIASCSVNDISSEIEISQSDEVIHLNQEFEREKENFDEMKIVSISDLEPDIVQSIDNAIEQLEMLYSTRSVQIMDELNNSLDPHPDIMNIYAFSLFRNGKWLKAIDVLDKAIQLFGPYGHIVYTRIIISLEMAEKGIYMKNIDGNSVFDAYPDDLPFDNDQFSIENYESALHDALYLYDKSDNDPELAYIIATIHSELGNYEDSNRYFKLYALLSMNLFEGDYQIALNNIKQKKYHEAEFLLTNLLKQYPASMEVLSALGTLYQETGNDTKLSECDNKYRFFDSIPDFMELDYDVELLEIIDFYINDNDSEKKITMYNEMYDNVSVDIIKISAIILYNHANHGNGLEELVVEKFIALGEVSVPTMIDLFKTPGISTCTMTKCCEVFTALKDERGWNVMADFLPQMGRLPGSLIPPAVPASLMLFDAERGARLIIGTIKTFILDDELNDTEAEFSMSEFNFGKGRLYNALEALPEEKIIEIAKECNYTSLELELLLKKIYN